MKTYIKWNKRGYRPYQNIITSLKTSILFDIMQTCDDDYDIIKRMVDRWFNPLEDVFKRLFNKGISHTELNAVLDNTAKNLNSLEGVQREKVMDTLNTYKTEIDSAMPLAKVFYHSLLKRIKEVA